MDMIIIMIQRDGRQIERHLIQIDLLKDVCINGHYTKYCVQCLSSILYIDKRNVLSVSYHVFPLFLWPVQSRSLLCPSLRISFEADDLYDVVFFKFFFNGTVQSRSQLSSNYGDGKAYSKPVYEASPLDRVLEQYGPGEEWHDNGKRVKTEYLSNTADGELSCRWYRTTDTRGDVQVSSNPGKCITRQALVQGVGKRQQKYCLHYLNIGCANHLLNIHVTTTYRPKAEMNPTIESMR